MDKNEKIALSIFVFVFLLISIFVIYNRNIKTDQTKIENLQNNASTDNNIEQVNTDTTTARGNDKNNTGETIIDNKIIAKKLSISPRCIGCGRCARTDREHFSVIEHQKAQVISQNNLDSSNLQMAISMCPESAISLISL